MAKKSDRIVSPTGDGRWKVLAAGAKRASATAATQGEAMAKARRIIRNAGGGEMSVQGRDGRIRAKDTVKPGNDPRNIKG